MSVLTKRGIAKYSRVAVESELSSASPHRLVQMLFQGALDKLAVAKGHVERKEFAKKSEHISWAISIIGGLRNSLDMENGGDIAANLDSLYEYMIRRLMEANRLNDLSILKEVTSLLGEIKEAWDAIPRQLTSADIRQSAISAKVSSL
jgi:flagellar protein FliS